MEPIIAKILRDFEDGFVNRRQLIQNLALAFSAAMGGKALAQTPAGQSAGAKDSPFKTVDLDHISYQVTDYRVTRDFYADLMGMEVKNDNCREIVSGPEAAREQAPLPLQPRQPRLRELEAVRQLPHRSITSRTESTIGIPIRSAMS